MAEQKTVPTRMSVDKFLQGIQDEDKRADCYRILEMMKRATKAEPRMWGAGIVGFGRVHYVYESGHEGDWFIAGFAPRKQNLTLYAMSGFNQFGDLLKKLGKHSMGKGCLYIRRLDDVDTGVLKKLIARSVEMAGKPARRADRRPKAG